LRRKDHDEKREDIHNHTICCALGLAGFNANNKLQKQKFWWESIISSEYRKGNQYEFPALREIRGGDQRGDGTLQECRYE
jgi:hypothetical protein